MSSSSHQTFAAAWARLSAVAVAMGLFLVLLIGLSGAHPAGAHVPGGSADHLTACIAPVRAGDHSAGVLAHPERFDCRRPAADWGPGSYWIRLTLPTGSPATTAAMPDRQLRFVPLWQQDLAVSVRDSRGRVVTRRYGDADLSRAIDFGGALAVPLDSAGSRGTDVLVRVDGALNASGLIGDPHLLDADTLHHDEVLAIAALAAFGGLGVGMLCYNLVLWLTIRERFQLTYCLSLLAMLTYVWASSGAMVQVFPDIAHTYRLATAYIMLGFASALSLQFITDFIEEDCLPSGLRRMARQFGIVYILAGLGVALAAPDWRHFADRLYALAYVPLPILLVSLTTIAWRRGSRSIRVLAVAWALPLLMALLRIAHALNVIEYGPLVQYALIIGMSFEAVLSSLAMSYRIKLITAERDRARADERAARQLANVDSLTGLLNRRALLEQLIEWRSPEPLRLLLVDIDRFKAVNDRHGHLVGDEVLRAVAEVLAIRADLNASVARLGGEEFALIGAAAELPEAVALGIIADIRSRPMTAGVRVTVSVGMAEGPVRGEDDWRELYRRADAALYQAKSDGRNRAVHAPTVQPAPPSTAAA